MWLMRSSSSNTSVNMDEHRNQTQHSPQWHAMVDKAYVAMLQHFMMQMHHK